MELEKFNAVLESSGLPVTYNAWPEREAPPLPYVCWLESGSSNFAADGVVYHPVKRLRAELYEAYRDAAAEQALESALDSFFYQKTPNYIDEEKCYQIIYELEV